MAELAASTTKPAAAKAKQTGLWRDTLGYILHQRSSIAGLVILTFLGLIALFAAQIAPFDPYVTMLDVPGQAGVVARQAPCIHFLGCPATQPEHFMGLDGNFRDVFSRVLYGTRISLFIGFVTAGISIFFGTIAGAVAGYASGWLDTIIMRVMDLMLVFPEILLAIAIVTVLGTGLTNAMLAISIVAIPRYARIMRASVITLREQDFVTASRALGESPISILLRRVLPNSLTPIVVAGTLGIGTAVLDVAALNFIGLGSALNTPEWGSMIGLERNNIFNAPHLLIFPGIALTLTVLAFNLLGDGIRDALDPRLNR
jgi:peptide/nickel transport system permease protein